MYRPSERELSDKIHTPVSFFKRALIEEKIGILESDQTLPYPYWIKEKDLLIDILQKQLFDYQKLIESRMEDLDISTKVFCTNEMALSAEDLQVFQTQWVYKMSYLTHELGSINEIKSLINRINNCNFKGEK